MDAPKQHIPIFVGSTYEDLRDYRDAVCEALHRLETIVRGMEYFGSKPGTPLEECIAVVRSCHVYIGVFAMRYGSLPEGHELSMTHLEYNEAQVRQLPSLIYLIDESQQPILPKFVETGEGAEKLKRLKELLRKKHTVSLFTTPTDLGSKILKDVPPLLATIGAKFTGDVPVEPAKDIGDVLRKFELLPKRVVGTEIEVEFEAPERWGHAGPATCEAMRIPVGDSIRAYVRLRNDHRYIFASGDIAETLLGTPKSQVIRAVAKLAYGRKEDDHGVEGDEVFGLVVTKLRNP